MESLAALFIISAVLSLIAAVLSGIKTNKKKSASVDVTASLSEEKPIESVK